MSLKIVSKKYAKLNNIQLKYLSKKVDKYNNEFVYYSIKNKDFDNIINRVRHNRRSIVQHRVLCKIYVF